MSRKYHIVIAKTFEGRWVMHFGDYDKEVARQERDDLAYHAFEHALTKAKVITLKNDTQSAIDAKLAELNAA